MSSHTTEALRDHVEQIAALLGDKMRESQSECIEKYFHDESDDHRYLRTTIDAALALLVEKTMTVKVAAPTNESSYQVGIAASYVRTHHVINTLLQQSNLIEASLLIRKQLESLARFKQLDSESYEAVRRKTPNIKHLGLAEVGRFYGSLSQDSHFADLLATELLGTSEAETPGGRSPHVFPTFMPKTYGMFQNQCILDLYFISGMIHKLAEWDSKLDLADLVAMGELAAQKASEMGFFMSEGVSDE